MKSPSDPNITLADLHAAREEYRAAKRSLDEKFLAAVDVAKKIDGVCFTEVPPHPDPLSWSSSSNSHKTFRVWKMQKTSFQAPEYVIRQVKVGDPEPEQTPEMALLAPQVQAAYVAWIKQMPIASGLLEDAELLFEAWLRAKPEVTDAGEGKDPTWTP